MIQNKLSALAKNKAMFNIYRAIWEGAKKWFQQNPRILWLKLRHRQQKNPPFNTTVKTKIKKDFSKDRPLKKSTTEIQSK